MKNVYKVLMSLSDLCLHLAYELESKKRYRKCKKCRKLLFEMFNLRTVGGRDS